VKNNLIGDVEEHLVRYLSETYPGRIHDKRICDAEELGFPSDIGLFQDTGFQGYHPADVHIYQPKKKPKGKELTPEEKAENTLISSIRILIAHSALWADSWDIHSFLRDWLVERLRYRCHV
jgi:hypothetical protein